MYDHHAINQIRQRSADRLKLYHEIKAEGLEPRTCARCLRSTCWPDPYRDKNAISNLGNEICSLCAQEVTQEVHG